MYRGLNESNGVRVLFRPGSLGYCFAAFLVAGAAILSYSAFKYSAAAILTHNLLYMIPALILSAFTLLLISRASQIVSSKVTVDLATCRGLLGQSKVTIDKGTVVRRLPLAILEIRNNGAYVRLQPVTGRAAARLEDDMRRVIGNKGSSQK